MRLVRCHYPLWLLSAISLFPLCPIPGLSLFTGRFFPTRNTVGRGGWVRVVVGCGGAWMGVDGRGY